LRSSVAGDDELDQATLRGAQAAPESAGERAQRITELLPDVYERTAGVLEDSAALADKHAERHGQTGHRGLLETSYSRLSGLARLHSEPETPPIGRRLFDMTRRRATTIDLLIRQAGRLSERERV
jgi:hypothetical protein